MTTLTPTQAAIAKACEQAIAHGVDSTLCASDFGIQRSAAGFTSATYVNADHAVTVLIDAYGRTALGVAALAWIHWPDIEADGDEDCTFCHRDTANPVHGSRGALARFDAEAVANG